MKDKAQIDEKMFGCSTDDLDSMASRYEYLGELSMLAVSILSDSQEELAMGNSETARQYINRAKYVIGLYHPRLRNIER
jgi:hypothetical protein